MTIPALAIFFIGKYTSISAFIKPDKNKIQEEDALKFLFECEYKNVDCSEKGLQLNLSTGKHNTLELLQKMMQKGLVERKDNLYFLTLKGKSKALKIIRIHRVYEKYLAETTGEKEENWHKKADFEEHFMSIEQANELAAAIGNPVFDPHGDPIPTISGNMPRYEGSMLYECRQGDNLTVIHVEDEPVEIFKKLTVAGIYPGTNLYLEAADGKKFIVFVNGLPVILSKLEAQNITVKVIDIDVREDRYIHLGKLKKGQKAVIVKLSPESRGLERRRFLDLGLVPGNDISVALESPLSNIRAYNVLDTKIALRHYQAQKIFVKPVEE